jgi:hypothetical protein
MDKTTPIAIMVINVFLILLAGFLCWHFNTLWGALVLLFMFYTKSETKSTNDKS